MSIETIRQELAELRHQLHKTMHQYSNSIREHQYEETKQNEKIVNDLMRRIDEKSIQLSKAIINHFE